MGSYNGAKVCKIVGRWTVLLDMLSKLFEKNYISLYRDDGLSKFRNITIIRAIKLEKILGNYF